MKRTHHCNELRLEQAGEDVTLSGWVHSCRDLGGVIFIDVRDREGRTQLVFDPQETDESLVEVASKLHSESVVTVSGKVRQRPDKTENTKISTGQIEVVVGKMDVDNHADVLPFQIDDPETAAKVNEELRLNIDMWICGVLRSCVICNCVVGLQLPLECSWRRRVFWRSKPRRYLNQLPKELGNFLCQAGFLLENFMRFRNHPNNSNKS